MGFFLKGIREFIIEPYLSDLGLGIWGKFLQSFIALEIKECHKAVQVQNTLLGYIRGVVKNKMEDPFL